MIETLMFSLIAGLFVYEIVVLRGLMKRSVNKTLRTFVKDWEPQPTSKKVLTVPSRSYAMQKSTEQIKD
ncbi:hypothetical protein SAMN05216389_10771 [Oceanobacillus limi]|uniref:Uncharacterized protein n=1 Tax=Oceanobacillus limi TaxID=930131 RepID=A0A1I0CTY2_9BACI|nr:hypothetical protein [Oceanobacillus limi]SET22986.1 hypothetical protein SAMN05216389_10771 [Oceanobacillus limi]